MRSKRFSVGLLLVAIAACAGPEGGEGVVEGAAAAREAVGGLQKNFPALDYLQTIPVAYETARAHPEVLDKIPCYCPCMLYGHRSLADCHRSQHSAACATCLEEAVMAGEVIAEHGGVDDAVAIAAEVKSRFRAAIVRNKLQAADLPALRSDGGRAYLAACSECHQPPHPGMYAASDWRQSLSRMEAYLDQSAAVQINEQTWNAAVEYIRETAATFPPESGERYRQSLAQAVEHLVITEGESANYPSNQDPILGPEWFDRMVKAYRLAREIPAAQLAAVQLDDPDPNCPNLLACLNSGGIVSEAMVDAVEKLAAELNLGNN